MVCTTIAFFKTNMLASISGTYYNTILSTPGSEADGGGVGVGVPPRLD